VKVALPEEYKGYAITGEVARLDLHPAGGYQAWLFSNRTDAWADEIRFPLLQGACAAQLKVDVDEVVPIIYDFSANSYTEVRSGKKDILAAGRNLTKFLDELKRIRPRGSGKTGQ
jgi:hypothetical protein